MQLLLASVWQHHLHEDALAQPGPEEDVFTLLCYLFMYLFSVVLHENVLLPLSQQHSESRSPLPTVTPMFRCCGPMLLQPVTRDTARTRCSWAKRSDWSGPPAPSFPACPERHRRSGRRSVCPPSCGWCSCGSSNAGHGSASRSSSWVCSCTGPSAWPPVGSTNTTWRWS